jgi:hypothetical protein
VLVVTNEVCLCFTCKMCYVHGWRPVGFVLCVVTGQTRFQKRKRARELSDCQQYTIAENGNPLPTTYIHPYPSICTVLSIAVSDFYVSEFLGAFVQLRKATIKLRHFCLSVRPHGTTRLPRDGFSSNLIHEYFSKFCPENSITKT